MTPRPQTTFATGANPFAPKAQKARTQYAKVVLDDITIVNDPIVARRLSYESKYESLFALLQDKSALRCKSSQTAGLSKALDKWAKKRYGNSASVRTTKNYLGDAGYGRVWLLVAGGAL